MRGSLKVVRHALQDAASVAGLLVTTEAMVAEKPEPKLSPEFSAVADVSTDLELSPAALTAVT